jgi:hypothetical protein
MVEDVTMTIAQIKQWARVIPLPVLDKIETIQERLTCSEVVKWLRVLLLTREQKIERARREAAEIAGSGEIHYQFQQRFGFVRLWVYTQKHGQYILDLGHQSHFIGPDAEFSFRDYGKIGFIARGTRLPYSDPTKTSSYLEIGYLG